MFWRGDVGYGVGLLIPTLVLITAWIGCVDVVAVRGDSMSPTLRDNQTVIVNRGAYGFRMFGRYIVRWGNPQAGDIIIYMSPQDGQAVVKRCAGVPLGQGIFMVGDNRANSLDSRQYGRVPFSAIYGRVLAH